jgi:hypothetical protein
MTMADAADVWVEVEVLKGGMVSVYRGRMSAADLERWSKGEIGQGGDRSAVCLHDTYWSYDEGDGAEGWVVVGATPGPYASARGITYIRADLILVIVPMRDGSEREAHRVRPVGSGTIDDDY